MSTNTEYELGELRAKCAHLEAYCDRLSKELKMTKEQSSGCWAALGSTFLSVVIFVCILCKSDENFIKYVNSVEGRSITLWEASKVRQTELAQRLERAENALMMRADTPCPKCHPK